MGVIEKMNPAQARDMFSHVARNMEASKGYLTTLDQAVGDGDHGMGMARGFKAVGDKLDGREFDSVGHLVKEVGNTLLMSTGGAAGAIFGSLFKGAATALNDRVEFDSAALADLLVEGLAAVQKRGGAKPGGKTMIDALAPAADQARAMREAPLGAALEAAAQAAAEGLERTRDMLAVTGKAKTLGERALGHPDPGAASMSLILKFMSEFAASAG